MDWNPKNLGAETSLARLKARLEARRSAKPAPAPAPVKPKEPPVQKANIFGGQKYVRREKVEKEIEGAKELYGKYGLTKEKREEIAKEWTDPKKVGAYVEEKDIKDIKKSLEEEKWQPVKKWEAEKKLKALKDIFKF